VVDKFLRSAGMAASPQSERIFAMKAALTSPSRRRAGHSEVVLAQAILGLLEVYTATIAVGN
jgi:hypothetical protein